MKTVVGVFIGAVCAVLIAPGAASADSISGEIVKISFEAENQVQNYGALTVKQNNGSYVRVILPKEPLQGLEPVSELRALQILNRGAVGRSASFMLVEPEEGYQQRYLVHRNTLTNVHDYGVGSSDNLETLPNDWKIVFSVTSSWESEYSGNYGWVLGKTKAGSYMTYFIRKKASEDDDPVSHARAMMLLNCNSVGGRIKVKYAQFHKNTSATSHVFYVLQSAHVEMK